VSEKLPSRKKALIFLESSGCSKEVINHCKAVSVNAVRTAKKIKRTGIKVNLQLVEIGALLHDVGRSKTHSVDHAVIGAAIAQQGGFPESVISIIKRHVGGGITPTEAKSFGWKNDIYVPLTIEEKIVSYADKLIEKSKIAPIEKTIIKLTNEKKIEAAKRVRTLYEEINLLIDDVE
jgi:uncharacterized protein